MAKKLCTEKALFFVLTFILTQDIWWYLGAFARNNWAYVQAKFVPAFIFAQKQDKDTKPWWLQKGWYSLQGYLHQIWYEGKTKYELLKNIWISSFLLQFCHFTNGKYWSKKMVKKITIGVMVNIIEDWKVAMVNMVNTTNGKYNWRLKRFFNSFCSFQTRKFGHGLFLTDL